MTFNLCDGRQLTFSKAEAISGKGKNCCRGYDGCRQPDFWAPLLVRMSNGAHAFGAVQRLPVPPCAANN